MTDESAPKTLNIWPGVVATAVVAAGMLGASAWAWDRIPDSVPVHFGIDGKADRWGSKYEALLIVPGVVALVGLLMAVVPLIGPRRNNLANSSAFYYAVWYGELGVMTVAHAALIAAAMGLSVNVSQIMFMVVGALFVVIGNYISKSRANWFAGFRTPWTLTSDYSWQKTHRFAGWMFLLTGLGTILAGALAGATAAFGVIIGGMALTIVLGTYLSYVYWKNDPERKA